MDGSVGEGSVGGVQSIPQKKAPKKAPKPLSKPPIVRANTDSALSVPSSVPPIPSPKPPGGSKQLPAISPKPRPGPISPKPRIPPPLVSPRPKPSGEKPSVPSSFPGLTNGGSPPAVATKPKAPPVKSKTWNEIPKASLEPTEGDTASDKQSTEKKPAVAKKPHNKPSQTRLSEPKEIHANNSPTEKYPVHRNSIDLNSQVTVLDNNLNVSHSANEDIVLNNENNSSVNVLSGPLQLSEEASNSEDTSKLHESFNTSLSDSAASKVGVTNASLVLPTDRSKELNKVKAKVIEVSRDVSQVDILPVHQVYDNNQDESICSAHINEALTDQSNEPEEPSLSTRHQVDVGSIEDLETNIPDRSESQRPSDLTPRSSVSSLASVNSSIDSYDLLAGRSSVKSRSSSRSIHSVGSSRRDSDSDEEHNIFEITSDIPEEDEEDVEAEYQSSEVETASIEDTNTEQKEIEHSCKEGHIKNEPLNDQDTAKHRPTSNVVADDDEGITLVAFAKNHHAEQLDDQLDLEGKEISTDFGTDRNIINNFGSSACEEEISADENLADNPTESKTNNETVEITNENVLISDSILVKGLSINKTQEDLSEDSVRDPCEVRTIVENRTNGSQKEEEEQEKEEQEQEQEEEEEEEEEEKEVGEEEEEVVGDETNEGAEGEERTDEMGKRSFSFLRKKKEAVLKYSPGEFHEQYEGSSKDKKSAQRSSIHDDKAAREETCKDYDVIPDEKHPSESSRRSPDSDEVADNLTTETADVCTGPVGEEDETAVAPKPAPRQSRQSLTRPVPRPRISLTHRGSLGNDSDESDEDEDTKEATDNVFKETHTSGVGSVRTCVDHDGEEGLSIGAMPSTSTQTAFPDQGSGARLSADGRLVNNPAEGLAIQEGDDRPFHHYESIEPIRHPAPRGASPAIEITSETSSPAPSRDYMYAASPTENQSMTMSATESEPLSDSNEMWSQTSEHAVSKPWDEVAAVTVAVKSMPEPLVPEFTHVSETSSTTSSASSLMSRPTEQNPDTGVFPLDDSSLNETEEEEEEEGGSLYDKVDIYDESYRSKDWKYRESEQEINAIVQPQPENDEEANEANDTISQLSEASSTATTQSEVEFKSSFGFGAHSHRIQRRRGSEDFVRLSRISRERKVTLSRQDGAYGLRIQKSKPVVITSLDPGCAAEEAGLKVGDMILAVNGQDVRQGRHSEVVKLVTEAPEPLVLVVGTVVCNSLNLKQEQTVMTGFMHKQESKSVLKQWRKRWFALKQDNCLYYYKTEQDLLPQGAIVLRNYTVTKARDAGKQFSFKLTKEGAKTHFFYTANEEERSSWGKAINDAANPNNKADIWLDISTHNVSLPALSIKEPECQGILTKLNKTMRNAKKRYCVLKDACLYYYKDMSSLGAQGVVHLHGYSIQETEVKGKKFAFLLKPPEEELREFFFFADHETDRKRWVAALAASIGRWIQTNAPDDDGEDDGTELLI